MAYKPGETYNITVYSDLHLDAASNAAKLMKAHMDERAKLPNALFVCIGDVGNWIMPGSDPRHTASIPIPELAGRDDYVNGCLDTHLKRLKGYPWIMIGMGNHEHTMLKHHGIDVNRLIINGLNADNPIYPVAYGGYSGFLRLRFLTKSTIAGNFNNLYHHGFSAGQAAGVPPPGVVRWAEKFEGWDVCTYGHNHHLGVKMQARLRMTSHGEIRHEKYAYVNTGTFQRADTQDISPDWAETKGFPPVAIGAPLIQIHTSKKQHKGSNLSWNIIVD